MKNNNLRMQTKKITGMAMLSALGVILAGLIHFSIIPAAPFLEYDPAGVPILIGAFLYGPWSGLLITFIVAVLQGTTVSAGSGIIGIVMHVLAMGSYVLVTGLIYKRNKTRKQAAVAIALGAITMTVVMVGCNLILTPLFLGQPIESVITLLLPAIIPFNLIKAGINGAITFVLYKPLSKFLKTSK